MYRWSIKNQRRIWFACVFAGILFLYLLFQGLCTLAVKRGNELRDRQVGYCKNLMYYVESHGRESQGDEFIRDCLRIFARYKVNYEGEFSGWSDEQKEALDGI